MMMIILSLLASVGLGDLIVGINIDPANPGGNPNATAVNVVGGAMVRIEFKDGTPAGPISPATFAMYDPVIGNFTEQGIQVLLIIDYMTYEYVPWGSTDPSAWDPYISQLATRAGQIAAHYLLAENITQIAYEIWNEEDLQQTLVPAGIYATMLQEVYSAIKQSSPSSPVVIGGLASGDPTYVSEVIAASSGGNLPADGLGLHPYGQRPTPNWPSPTWGFGVLGDLLSSYNQVTSLPVWVTEYGTNDMTSQGDFPWHAFTALSPPNLPTGFIIVFLVFSLSFSLFLKDLLLIDNIQA